jgi:hypothetical protein
VYPVLLHNNTFGDSVAFPYDLTYVIHNLPNTSCVSPKSAAGFCYPLSACCVSCVAQNFTGFCNDPKGTFILIPCVWGWRGGGKEGRERGRKERVIEGVRGYKQERSISVLKNKF